MSSENQTSYAKIGFFIVAGVALIAATVVYAITLLIYRIVSAHPDNRFCRFVLHGGIGRKNQRQAA